MDHTGDNNPTLHSPTSVFSDGELSWHAEQPLMDGTTLPHTSSPEACPVADMSITPDVSINGFDLSTTIDPTYLDLTDLSQPFLPVADETAFSEPLPSAAAVFPSDPNVGLWNFPASLAPYPPSDALLRTCVELSTSQIQALLSRVHTLELMLQETEKKFQEFLDWSKKMEKHNEESSNIILSLVGTVKNSEYYRSASSEPQDRKCDVVFS